MNNITTQEKNMIDDLLRINIYFVICEEKKINPTNNSIWIRLFFHCRIFRL